MTDAVEVLRIDSLEDERLDAYVRLTERELRCVLEPQKGIFIAESAKVIERAVRAGYEPVSFLLGERWLDQMMPLFERLAVREGAGPVPVFVASMELMERLTGFNVTRGALAAFRRPRQIPVDEFLGGVVEAAGSARCACACSRALSTIPMWAQYSARRPRSTSTAFWSVRRVVIRCIVVRPA